MKKKTIVIIIVVVVLALIIAAAVYIGVRLHRHGTDIIGVTTLTDRNTVIMNAVESGGFKSGTGVINVGEGERIRLDYDVSGGSFDFAFAAGEDAVFSAVRDADNMDVAELPTDDVMPETPPDGETGLEGAGSVDFDVEPGAYTVYFTMHGAIGTATVTAAR